MNRNLRSFTLVFAVFSCVLFSLATSAAVVAAESEVDFNRDIRPLLSSRCFACHGPDEAERAAGLRLDSAEGAQEDLGGYAAIVPGDPDDSELILRIESDDPDMRMPPEGKGEPFSKGDIEKLRQWIAQGADYAKHWSYEKPRRPELPEIQREDWPRHPIDHFVLAQMEARGLSPSPAADRWTLARRVALDLTGLPPTWQEASDFVHDPRENAYELYVDQQLAKQSFGERWARVWLDLARYADSAGYADDPPRTIWAYRDYVIRALNENKPFDQFTIEQIAGDLLDDPSDEQLIATAFHRNTLTNNEGGTNDEEFRNVAVVDRVNTTMAVWMGTTMACAQCHTHKYDPITQDEYFQFFDFFNQSADADRRDESPLLEVWSDPQRRQQQELREQVAELEKTFRADSDALDADRQNWLASLKHQPQWTTLQPVSADAEANELSIDSGGWVSIDKPAAENDRYSTVVDYPGGPLAAIRLEVPAEQTDNFVLSKVAAVWSSENQQAVDAQYVRVQLPGKSRILHLAELQVFSDGVNIATKGKASQSSTDYGGKASYINDGNTDGSFEKKSVTHTATEENPWVEIDLGQVRSIANVVVWNRTDGGQAIRDRIKGYQVSLLDENREVVWQQTPDGIPNPQADLIADGTVRIPFEVAIADHEQDGFPASSVLAAKIDPKKGWAVAPQTGKPHQLTLLLEQPKELRPGRLTLNLHHQSMHKHHVLNRFRWSMTDDAEVTRWARLPADVRQIVNVDAKQRSDAQQQRLAEYHRTISPVLAEVRKQLADSRRQLNSMKPQTTVPVMKELPKENRRETFVQIRGNYQSTGDKVSAGVPDAFHPLPENRSADRLALARWLVDEDNPLTARVVVNRHWEQIFGRGIVETSEEFGSQGEMPSHPRLLDWLAVDLHENGWDLKRLLKQIMMSATYRQSSVTSEQLQAVDPDNRWLARGPRFRISAEMVRDQALFVSGLLSDKMFGPPVKPPQPELGLKAAFGSATDWSTSQGEDRYRRGLYTTWRRSSPYPSMAQFDAPNREVCTVRRIRTNTPLQALVTLNDPVYVEAAQSLARRMIEQGEDPESRITFAFRRSLIRDPDAKEVERLKELARNAYKHYSADSEAAKQMATKPRGPLPDDADVADYAAWTVVANVILNLDEMFMKR